MKQIETWDDLATAIAEMSEDQRRQPIQCVHPTPNGDEVQALEPGIAIGTVGEFDFTSCRSVHDNKYRPQDVVLLLDGNPFAEDGAVAYEWKAGEEDIPIYGKGGKTERAEQMAPNRDDLVRKFDDGILTHTGAVCAYRLAKMSDNR